MPGQRNGSLLGQTALGQWAPHSAIAGGLQSRPVFAPVIRVRTVGHHRNPQKSGRVSPRGRTICPAVVTTIGMVLLIIRVRQFLGLDHLVPNADQGGQFTASVQFARCQARWRRSPRPPDPPRQVAAALANMVLSRPPEKSDGTTLEASQQVQQPVTFGGKFGRYLWRRHHKYRTAVAACRQAAKYSGSSGSGRGVAKPCHSERSRVILAERRISVPALGQRQFGGLLWT